jgi:hypothetical protein
MTWSDSHGLVILLSLQTFVLKIFQKINLEGWAQSIFFTQCWLDWNRWYLSVNLGGPLVCGFIVSLRQLFGYLCYKWSIGHRLQPRMIVHCYFSFIGCLIAAIQWDFDQYWTNLRVWWHMQMHKREQKVIPHPSSCEQFDVWLSTSWHTPFSCSLTQVWMMMIV